jgi:predicted ATPase/DNA-binding CsgD family transcriptional regulator
MSAATHPHPFASAPPTPLIGREREIERVSARLLAGGVRLLTLTGPPGIGKTRLALAVAARLRDAPAAAGGGRAFADGVCFVPLAALRDPAQVLPAIARGLGLVEHSDLPPLGALRLYLHTKRLLLVLDNFEQVLPAAPEIAELLAAAPSLTALVTSRAALHLAAEHRFPVPPLTLPPPPTGCDPPVGGAAWLGVGAEDVSRYEAVRLFVARAQAVQPAFALTPENAPAVAEVCRRLDGLPLAIELAAARIAVLPPRGLLTRLERRLPLLTGGARDLPARHRTLGGAIAWSYELLDERDRAAFRRLGVFVGGASLEAAEAVCRASGDGEATAPPPVAGGGAAVLERLASLVEKSLVHQDEAAGGEPRFRMLETIREYALERLEADGESDSARRRHAGYYVGLAEAARPWLGWGAFAERGPWLERLAVEHDNLRQALAWSQAAPAAAADGGALGVRLAAALGQFWRRHGHWSEGRRWLAGALALPAAAPPTAARATILQDAGTMAAWQGHFATGRASLDAAVALWRALGDRQGLAGALSDLAWPLINLGEGAAARAAAQEGVALCRALDDRPGLALALRWLGNALHLRPDASAAERRQAEALWGESLALFREVGDDEGASMPLNMLAARARARGDYAAARSLLEEAVALRRKATRGAHLALVLAPLGEVAEIEGDAAEAERCFSEALTLFRAAGDRQHTAGALVRLGDLASRRGDTPCATERYAEGLDLARRAGGASVIARALAGQAALAQQAGDLVRAGALYADGMAALRQPDRWPPDAVAGAAARCLIGLAGVEAARGRPERAARLLGAAPATLAALGRRLEPPDAADHAAATEVVRATLGEPAFAVAYDAGRAMSPAQARAYALQEDDRPPPAPAAATTARRPAGGLAPLTPREGEVAALVAAGFSNLEIADRLHVTERTVENHVAHSLAKLGFRSRVQIATWATAQGLVPRQA